MTKTRIYELAKDLNTTSKRLMEKLKEIDIVVKNHMSFLEDDELKALYKHIGIAVTASEGEKAVELPREKEEAKPKEASVATPAAGKSPVTATPAQQQTSKSTISSAPRIIRRKTEVFLDSETKKRDSYTDKYNGKYGAKNRSEANKKASGGRGISDRSPYLVRSDNNSGLRPGFTRVDKNDYKSIIESYSAEAGRQPKTEGIPGAALREGTGRAGRAPAAGTVGRQPAGKPQEVSARITEAKTAVTATAAAAEAAKTQAAEAEATKAVTAAEAAKTAAAGELKGTSAVAAKATVAGVAPDIGNDTGTAVKAAGSMTGVTNDVKAEVKAEAGAKAKTDVKTAVKAEAKPEIKSEIKPEIKTETKVEARPETKAETKPETITVTGTEAKTETKPETKTEPGTRTKPEAAAASPSGTGRPTNTVIRKPAVPTGAGTPSSHAGRMQGAPQVSGAPQAGTVFGRPADRRYPPAGGERPHMPRESSYGRDAGTGRSTSGGSSSSVRPYSGAPGYGSRGQSESRPGAARDGRSDDRRGRPYSQQQQQQGGMTAGSGRPRTGGAERPRPGFGRDQGDRITIPKPELSETERITAAGSQRGETRREYQPRNTEKDEKKDFRKETAKAQTVGREVRFDPKKMNLAEKKGVSEVLSEDFVLNEFYNDDNLKAKKTLRSRRPEKPKKIIPPRAVLTHVLIPSIITVKDLAETLKKTSADVIKKLLLMGTIATLNQEIDYETAAIIADEFGIKAEKQIEIKEEDILFDDVEDTETELVQRPPVVVVMGHVDHGKTSLLDAIRHSNVIDSEAGGITQHIGAYTVMINDRKITFLDTPGHEAFTAMRARGAQVTDIAILVVAADDGVMPQTVEAINHAKAANVSIIVAINKIDKQGANPEKVKQELTEYGLVSEEWGGDTICVPVSAKNLQNIDQLLEMVILTADILELKADPGRQAKGTIVEARLDKSKGAIATALVQRGTLKTGDSIITGTTVGRIRAMTDDKGETVISAGPSMPVEILGLPEVPLAGEVFYAIEDEKVARNLAEKRKNRKKDGTTGEKPKVTLEDLFNQIQEGMVKELNIVVKADVQGSAEAVRQSLEKLSNPEVRINVIHEGVGAITESDVSLADVSNAIIIGFNVRPAPSAAEAAKSTNVDMRLYSVIYNAIEDIEAAMKGMLDPSYKESVDGHAEIRQIFKVSGIGTIAGCYVTDGRIVRSSDVRVIRGGIVIHQGKLGSLKRFKDDAREVTQGFECGLSLEKFNEIRESDIVEAYSMVEVERE